MGLLLHAIVHPADIQDRDGGILLLATLFGMYPFLKKLFADAGYQGPNPSYSSECGFLVGRKSPLTMRTGLPSAFHRLTTDTLQRA